MAQYLAIMLLFLVGLMSGYGFGRHSAKWYWVLLGGSIFMVAMPLVTVGYGAAAVILIKSLGGVVTFGRITF